MSQRVLRISLVVLLAGGIGLAWWSRDTVTPAAVVAWVEGPRRLGAARLCGRLLVWPQPCLSRERSSRWPVGRSLDHWPGRC